MSGGLVLSGGSPRGLLVLLGTCRQPGRSPPKTQARTGWARWRTGGCSSSGGSPRPVGLVSNSGRTRYCAVKERAGQLSHKVANLIKFTIKDIISTFLCYCKINFFFS